MKSLDKNNKGFSLVEILVSMVILAIIIVPIFDNFIVAGRANSKARRIQSANSVSLNVLEGLKATEDLKTIAKQFDYPNKPGEEFNIIDKTKVTLGISELAKSGGQYTSITDPGLFAYDDLISELRPVDVDDALFYFGMAGIENKNLLFDVLVTMDGSTDYRTIAATPAPGAEKANDFQMPILSTITKEGNAIITQKEQDNWAKDTLYSNYPSYCSAYLTAHPTAAPLPTYDRDSFAADIARKISVTINYDAATSFYEVICGYEYTTPKIDNTLSKSKVFYELYRANEVTTLDNIYLFFDPIIDSKDTSIYDVVEITNNVAIQAKAKVNVYLVEQARVKERYDTAHGIGSYDSKLPSYYLGVNINEPNLSGALSTSVSSNINSTNIHYGGEAGTSYITEDLIDYENEIRLYNVKIEVFKSVANESGRYLPDNLLATFNTTRGE